MGASTGGKLPGRWHQNKSGDAWAAPNPIHLNTELSTSKARPGVKIAYALVAAVD
jgi:hypothetical protein